MPEIKKYKITEPYLDVHCGLGEAPYVLQNGIHDISFTVAQY